MKHVLVPLLFLLVAACGGRGSSDLWERSTIYEAKQRGTLRVALEPTFPPFEYMESGRLVGFDVDLARILAQELEVDIEFVQVDFKTIIAHLNSEKADLIISGMTATPLRALEVSYSDPYFHTVTCLLVSKQRASDVESIRDLNQPGRRVVVKISTTGHKAALKHCPKAEIIPLENEKDLASEVATGRADAFLFDKRAIELQHEANPDTTFTILDPVSVEPYSIACRKGDPETIEWINLVLHHMRRDGRLKELYAKYDLEDASAE